MFLNVANYINGALVMEKILNKIESPDDLKKLNKDEYLLHQGEKLN